MKQVFAQHASAGLLTFARKANCVSLILLFLQSVPAAAGPLEDANAAIKRRDYATAARIIRPEAEQGDANAQYNLGLFYDNGLGVPQDHIRAYMWLSLAAAQGRENAAALRDLIARHMTGAQIMEAQELAREWKSKTKNNNSWKKTKTRRQLPTRRLLRQ